MIGDPRNLLPKNDGPKDKHRIKYIWRDVSADPELEFLSDINNIMDTARNMAQVQDGDSIKAMLKKELAPSGWGYNGRATFRANFPFRSRHVIFDSTEKLDADVRYRLKVAVHEYKGLDYKVLKWVPKIGPDSDIIGMLTDLITTKKGLAILFTCIALLIILSIILC